MGKHDKYIVYKDHVAFWGSEFSNFWPCKFILDGIEWKSSEQYFMAMKARHFHDMATYNLILKAETPKEAKALGRQVKFFDSDEWGTVCDGIMYTAVFAKFTQNKYLRDLLLSPEFEGKKFVEGSPVDKIWGCGIQYDDPRIDDESNWIGGNLLGKTLDKLRNNLKVMPEGDPGAGSAAHT